MNLHSLRPAKGATHNSKRKGRGIGSGKGRTSTRGHKGAKSRSGYSSKRGFEGGQVPLQMRLPKRGFNSYNRITYNTFNLYQLENIVEKYGVSELTLDKLRDLGLIGKTDKVKILSSGEITKAIKLEVNAVSASAKEAIEGKGGSITLV